MFSLYYAVIIYTNTHRVKLSNHCN